VHVFHAAEFSFQRGGKNNDGNFRTLITQRLRYFSTELARSQVIVEYGDVDFIEMCFSFFNGGRADGFIAVAAQDRGCLL
jgi:hypothetical protein